MEAHPDLLYLQECARQIRRDVVEMIYRCKDGHPSPSFSAADIIAALYFHIMNIDPQNPDWENRDRFILSKGHGCPALYSALARKGFFDPEELLSLRRIHSNLQGHPYAPKTKGMDGTTGSLGNGISLGLGIALAGRIKQKDYRVYVLTGDGELAEGLIWEAAMSAAHLRVSNLTVFVDNNNYQSGGTVADISGLYPIRGKFEQFGWHCQEIDGHDIQQIITASEKARGENKKPSVIIARTIKGKGLPFMEGDNSWHKRVFTDTEYAEAQTILGTTV